MTNPSAPSRSRPTIERSLLALALLSAPFTLQIALTKSVLNEISVRFTLSELVLAAMALAFARSLWRRARPGPFSVIVGLLALLHLASSLLRASIGPFVESVQFVLAFALPYFVLRSVADDKDAARRLTILVGLSGLVAATLGLLQWSLGASGFFVRGGLPNNHVLGLYLIVALPFALGAALRIAGRRPWLRIAVPSAAVACFILALFDAGQAAAMALEAAVFVFLLSGGNRSLVRGCATAVLALGLHAAVHPASVAKFLTLHEYRDVPAAYAKSVGLAQFPFGNVISIARGGRNLSLRAVVLAGQPFPEEIAHGETNPAQLKHRYSEWGAALRMMGANPALGVGPGNYRPRISEYFPPLPKTNTTEPDASNGWLILGGTLGLPGLFIVLAGLLGASAAVCGRIKTSPFAGDEESLLRIVSASSCVGVFLGGFWSPLLQAGTTVPLAALFAVADRAAFGDGIQWNRQGLRTGPVVRWGANAILLGSLVYVLSQVLTVRPTSPEYVWFEAESAKRLVAPMRKTYDMEASKRAMIEIPDGAGRGWLGENGGEAEYSLDIKTGGIYSFWARTRWIDGCGNSIAVAFNGDSPRGVGNDAVFGEWHWVKGPDVQLPAGANRVCLSNREDGVAVDKILLTTDPEFRPEGIWESVFTRDLSRTPLVGWRVPGPEGTGWKRAVTPEFSGVTLRSEDPTGSLFLVDSETARPCAIEVDFRFADPSASFLIYYGYENADDNRFFEISSGTLSLVRLTEGNRLVARSAPIPSSIAPGNHKAVAEIREGILSFSLDGTTLLDHVDRQPVHGRCGFAAAAGEVGVATFNIHPLEGVFFLDEPSPKDAKALPVPQTIDAGDSSWSDYCVTLTIGPRGSFEWVRFNKVSEKDYLELTPGDQEYGLRHVVDGAVGESHTFTPGALTGNAVSTLTIRSVDREIMILLGDTIASRVVLGPSAPVRGAVQLRRSGPVAIRVKGIQRFFDGFGGCDGNNDASWTALKGKWKVLDGSGEGLEASYACLSAEPAIVLAGEPYWSNYELRCMARLRSAAGAGLFSYFTDESNFDLLRLAPKEAPVPYAGRIEYVRCRKGVDKVLASKELSAGTEDWLQIERLTMGTSEILLVNGAEILRVPRDDAAQGRIGLFSEGDAGLAFDNVCVDLY